MFRLIIARDGNQIGMPNHANREREILNAQQQKLADASRRPSVEVLSDADLLALIKALDDARARASATTAEDGLSPQGLLSTALNRAQAERRRRKLPPASGARQRTGKTVVAKGDSANRAAKRVPASTRRSPADRKTAEARKSDLRTSVRRVKKPAKAAASDQTVTAAAAQIALPPVGARTEAAPEDGKTRKNTVKKAAKLAEKAAEKEARKAARKAEKEAVRAARKAARVAAKEAEKALRKAERKAERKSKTANDDTAVTSKDKSKKKKKKDKSSKAD